MKILTPSQIAQSLGITEKSGTVRIPLATPVHCKCKYCDFYATAVEITERAGGKTKMVVCYTENGVEYQTYFTNCDAVAKKAILSQII